MDLLKNCTICSKCESMLNASYNMAVLCMESQNRIQNYMQQICPPSIKHIVLISDMKYVTNDDPLANLQYYECEGNFMLSDYLQLANNYCPVYDHDYEFGIVIGYDEADIEETLTYPKKELERHIKSEPIDYNNQGSSDPVDPFDVTIPLDDAVPCDVAVTTENIGSDLEPNIEMQDEDPLLEPLKETDLIEDTEIQLNSEKAMKEYVKEKSLLHRCRICFLEFKIKKKLRIHQMKKHQKTKTLSKFKCYDCNKQFYSLFRLDFHKQRCLKDGLEELENLTHKDVCSIIGDTYKPDVWKPVRCMICGHNFRFKKLLHEHNVKFHTVDTQPRSTRSINYSENENVVPKIKNQKIRKEFQACDECGHFFKAPWLAKHKLLKHPKKKLLRVHIEYMPELEQKIKDDYASLVQQRWQDDPDHVPELIKIKKVKLKSIESKKEFNVNHSEDNMPKLDKQKVNSTARNKPMRFTDFSHFIRNALSRNIDDETAPDLLEDNTTLSDQNIECFEEIVVLNENNESVLLNDNHEVSEFDQLKTPIPGKISDCNEPLISNQLNVTSKSIEHFNSNENNEIFNALEINSDLFANINFSNIQEDDVDKLNISNITNDFSDTEFSAELSHDIFTSLEDETTQFHKKKSDTAKKKCNVRKPIKLIYKLKSKSKKYISSNLEKKIDAELLTVTNKMGDLNFSLNDSSILQRDFSLRRNHLYQNIINDDKLKMDVVVKLNKLEENEYDSKQTDSYTFLWSKLYGRSVPRIKYTNIYKCHMCDGYIESIINHIDNKHPNMRIPEVNEIQCNVIKSELHLLMYKCKLCISYHKNIFSHYYQNHRDLKDEVLEMLSINVYNKEPNELHNVDSTNNIFEIVLFSKHETSEDAVFKCIRCNIYYKDIIKHYNESHLLAGLDALEVEESVFNEPDTIRSFSVDNTALSGHKKCKDCGNFYSNYEMHMKYSPQHVTGDAYNGNAMRANDYLKKIKLKNMVRDNYIKLNGTEINMPTGEDFLHMNCDYCGKSFKFAKSLIGSKLPKKNIRCVQCHGKFQLIDVRIPPQQSEALTSFKNPVVKSMKVSDSLHQCRLCNGKFRYMEQHMAKMHSNCADKKTIEITKKQCVFCTAKVKFLEAHISDRHIDDIVPNWVELLRKESKLKRLYQVLGECLICGETFNDVSRHAQRKHKVILKKLECFLLIKSNTKKGNNNMVDESVHDAKKDNNIDIKREIMEHSVEESNINIQKNILDEIIGVKSYPIPENVSEKVCQYCGKCFLNIDGHIADSHSSVNETSSLIPSQINNPLDSEMEKLVSGLDTYDESSMTATVEFGNSEFSDDSNVSSSINNLITDFNVPFVDGIDITDTLYNSATYTECAFCKKHWRNLMLHLIETHNVCTNCTEPMADMHTFVYHLKKCFRIENVCEYCCESYTCVQSMNRHTRSINSFKSRYLKKHKTVHMHCVYCKANFFHGCTYNKHGCFTKGHKMYEDRIQSSRATMRVRKTKKKIILESDQCIICQTPIPYDNIDAHYAEHVGRPCLECSVCSAKFTDQNKANTHITRHRDFTLFRYKCTICDGYNGGTFTKYLQHILKEHFDVSVFNCIVCDKYFPARAYFLHIKSHVNYFCKICNRLHKTISDSLKHVEIKNAVVCRICGLQCLNECCRNNHEQAKHNIFHDQYLTKTYKLKDVDEYPFESMFSEIKLPPIPLNDTIEYHKLIKFLTPTTSNISLSRCIDFGVNQLSNFVKKHKERNRSENMFCCKHCGKFYPLFVSCIEHETQCSLRQSVVVLSKPSKSIDPNVCVHCGIYFKEIEMLQVHIKISHFEYSYFDCDHCHLSFENADAYLIHSREHIHINNRFQCPICDYSSDNRIIIFEHKKSHYVVLSSNQMNCNDCGTTFKNAENHFRHHSKLKPYNCHICKIRFCLNRSYIKHKTVHSQNSTRQCEICLQDFKSADDLFRHIDTHVEIEIEITTEGNVALLDHVYGRKITKYNKLEDKVTFVKNNVINPCDNLSLPGTSTNNFLNVPITQENKKSQNQNNYDATIEYVVSNYTPEIEATNKFGNFDISNVSHTKVSMIESSKNWRYNNDTESNIPNENMIILPGTSTNSFLNTKISNIPDIRNNEIINVGLSPSGENISYYIAVKVPNDSVIPKCTGKLKENTSKSQNISSQKTRFIPLTVDSKLLKIGNVEQQQSILKSYLKSNTSSITEVLSKNIEVVNLQNCNLSMYSKITKILPPLDQLNQEIRTILTKSDKTPESSPTIRKVTKTYTNTKVKHNKKVETKLKIIKTASENLNIDFTSPKVSTSLKANTHINNITSNNSTTILCNDNLIDLNQLQPASTDLDEVVYIEGLKADDSNIENELKNIDKSNKRTNEFLNINVDLTSPTVSESDVTNIPLKVNSDLNHIDSASVQVTNNLTSDKGDDRQILPEIIELQPASTDLDEVQCIQSRYVENILENINEATNETITVEKCRKVLKRSIDLTDENILNKAENEILSSINADCKNNVEYTHSNKMFKLQTAKDITNPETTSLFNIQVHETTPRSVEQDSFVIYKSNATLLNLSNPISENNETIILKDTFLRSPDLNNTDVPESIKLLQISNDTNPKTFSLHIVKDYETAHCLLENEPTVLNIKDQILENDTIIFADTSLIPSSTISPILQTSLDEYTNSCFIDLTAMDDMYMNCTSDNLMPPLDFCNVTKVDSVVVKQEITDENEEKCDFYKL